LARDPEIQKIFEITDDSLQGLLGYFYYVINAIGWAPVFGIFNTLPKDQIPLTHEWDRNYDRQELILEMNKSFVAYQTRTTIVAMVNVFEVATKKFLKRLNDTSHPQQNIRDSGKFYKQRLDWVFKKVERSSFGNVNMQTRIPQLCLDVDHARRLRNISVHNNGLFDDRYESDAIQVGDSPGLTHPDFQKYSANRSIPVTPILQPSDYIQMSKSHIELLHFLHHEIQSQDFGETTPYNYREQLKRIEWHRLLFGF
jgi:hypothetical protein